MTLGRTSSNAIKIKTDGTAGLRAVECACCGPIDPCLQCPPVNKNFNFSVSSSDLMDLIEEFQDPPTQCCTPIRTCQDSWGAAYGGYIPDYPGFFLQQNVGAYLSRANNGVCGWNLSFYAYGSFKFTFMGYDDVCPLPFSEDFPNQFISGDNPEGSYDFTFYGQCLPPPWQSSPTQFPFNFTVTIS
jgi:hypothetical protein